MFNADWRDVIIVAMVLVFLGFCCRSLIEFDCKVKQATQVKIEQVK